MSKDSSKGRKSVESLIEDVIRPILRNVPKDGTATTPTRISRSIGVDPRTVQRWVNVIYLIQHAKPRINVRQLAGGFTLIEREHKLKESAVEIEE